MCDPVGKWLAVLLVAPLLCWRGYVHGDIFVLGLGVILFVWDVTFLAYAS